MTRYLTVLMLIALVVAGVVAQDDEDGEDMMELPLTENMTYVIEAGDTLDVLAATFDVDLDCLRETNDLVPADILSPGDTILIDLECPTYTGLLTVEFPRDEPLEEAVPLGEEDDESTEDMEDMSDEDMADEDMEDMSDDEDMTDDDMEDMSDEDMEEAMPLSESDGEIYVVQLGDTLDVIGQDFDVSVEAIALANDISDPNELEIGQELLIPADAPPYGQVPALDGGVGQGGGGDGEPYVVQRGDTLDVIGQEFNVSVVSLKVVNDIANGRSLVPGQTIIIPADAPAYGLYPALDGGLGRGGGGDGELYVVQPRDTLDVIGQEYDVSVVSLLVVNGLERGIDLEPGMTILIPADAPAYGFVPALDGGAGAGGGGDGELYVLQPRETVDGVSARFNKNTYCVLEANDILNPRTVRAGTTLFIPNSCPEYSGFDIVPPQDDDES